ncbi:hypothetical protein Tco_0770754 [Tanacetum coccineum]|uniref:Uncharacterized protein n=1 Tax=Tanacetum coccineum TaxID=301880 RepID=A0ABQ4ZGZ7_9ASTR
MNVTNATNTGIFARECKFKGSKEGSKQEAGRSQNFKPVQTEKEALMTIDEGQINWVEQTTDGGDVEAWNCVLKLFHHYLIPVNPKSGWGVMEQNLIIQDQTSKNQYLYLAKSSVTTPCRFNKEFTDIGCADRRRLKNSLWFLLHLEQALCYLNTIATKEESLLKESISTLQNPSLPDDIQCL